MLLDLFLLYNPGLTVGVGGREWDSSTAICIVWLELACDTCGIILTLVMPWFQLSSGDLWMSSGKCCID